MDLRFRVSQVLFVAFAASLASGTAVAIQSSAVTQDFEVSAIECRDGTRIRWEMQVRTVDEHTIQWLHSDIRMTFENRFESAVFQQNGETLWVRSEKSQ